MTAGTEPGHQRENHMNQINSFSAVCRLFFLIAMAIFLCSCKEVSSPPRIERIANEVEGFDLVFEDPSARAEFGLFDVTYAIKANYGFFTYRGKLYRPVGGGSVLIYPIASSPADFVVRETAQAVDERGYVKKSLLQISDKRNGNELARRSLVAHSVEDGTGWTGDHATKFIRRVLTSPQAPNRPWGVFDYPPAVATVALTKSLGASPYQLQVDPRNCPGTVRIERKPHDSTVTGEGFEFLPKAPLKLVACDSARVLVASGVYAADLYFDVLTLDGEHISQGYVRLPLPLESHWAELVEVGLDGKNVKAVLRANFRPDKSSTTSAYAQVRVNVTPK